MINTLCLTGYLYRLIYPCLSENFHFNSSGDNTTSENVTCNMYNYLGFNSYIAPPMWLYVFPCVLYVYLYAVNVCHFFIKKERNELIYKQSFCFIINNLFQITSNLIFFFSEDDPTAEIYLFATIFTILAISANIVGIHFLKIFEYGSSFYKLALFDVPVSLLFSWNTIDMLTKTSLLLHSD